MKHALYCCKPYDIWTNEYFGYGRVAFKSRVNHMLLIFFHFGPKCNQRISVGYKKSIKMYCDIIFFLVIIGGIRVSSKVINFRHLLPPSHNDTNVFYCILKSYAYVSCFNYTCMKKLAILNVNH